jgi:hypothetical protein
MIVFFAFFWGVEKQPIEIKLKEKILKINEKLMKINENYF